MNSKLHAALEANLRKKIYVETMYWACQGLTNKEIGDKVFRSRQCIAFRFDQMSQEFGTHNRRELLKKILCYNEVNCQSLTPIRQTILKMLSTGMTTKDVSAELGLNKSTVKWYTTYMRRDIGAKSNLQMIAMYWERMT